MLFESWWGCVCSYFKIHKSMKQFYSMTGYLFEWTVLYTVFLENCYCQSLNQHATTLRLITAKAE